MSDTPRTDKEAARHATDLIEDYNAFDVWRDFARELERENAQLRKDKEAAEAACVAKDKHFRGILVFCPVPQSELRDDLEIIRRHSVDALKVSPASMVSRVEELEKHVAEYGAVAVEVVPGPHGMGVEQPASPEFLKHAIDHLQKEWDGAEVRTQSLTAENRKLEVRIADLVAAGSPLREKLARVVVSQQAIQEILDWDAAVKGGAPSAVHPDTKVVMDLLKWADEELGGIRTTARTQKEASK